MQNNNQVILWSHFYEPTKEDVVPKMRHVFTTEFLDRYAGGGVKVDVARYYMGQWRTWEF